MAIHVLISYGEAIRVCSVNDGTVSMNQPTSIPGVEQHKLRDCQHVQRATNHLNQSGELSVC